MTKHKESSIDELLANPFDQTIEMAKEKDIAYDFTNEKTINLLSEYRQEQARELAEQIDPLDLTTIISYGANAQKKLSEFSDQVLNEIQLKDTGEVGEIITDLMNQLNRTDVAEFSKDSNIFGRLFNRARASIAETQMKYRKVGSQIDKLASRLDREKNELLMNNHLLEQIYDKNKDYYEALNIYIAAGELKMEELQNTLIPQALKKSQESTDQMAVQTLQDYQQFLDRLDKRVHDLRLTRQMTIQQAPQIRMIQHTNQSLAEKIQNSIHTAIPLWKNQITIALTLLRQQDAIKSQQQVSKTTNDLLLKNSELLKQGTIETAKESERGIIDLETLQKTQKNLIETLESTLRIQEEGRSRRRQAEMELQKLEHDLQNQLLTISSPMDSIDK